MEVLYIVLTAVFSVFMLYLLTRATGYREIHQFTMFDYIIGISIGSIAAEMATNIGSLKRTFTAMLVYGAAAILMAAATKKSIKIRKKLIGQPIILMNNGIIYYDRMKKARLDLSELLMELRVRDYFDISEIKTIIMEINGNFSIIPFNIQNKSNTLAVNLIMDREVIYENLRAVGITEEDIKNAVNKKGIKDTNEVFLAVYSKREIKLFKRVNADRNDKYIF